uniref:Adenosine deaminase tRNA specific 3 n=1 Tax=Hucho hucho TaxID=62062 RepID=A0A4W5NZG2_9TELE
DPCDIDSWVAYPVLSNVHTHDAELIEAFAAPILATVYPLPGLTHTNRVRACKDKCNPHPSGGLGNLFLVKTPACPPLTRSKFEQARKHCPTSYYEDKQVTVALKGQLFTSQKAKMQDYRMAAVAAARAGQERGMDAVGAAVVDPEAVRIVAVGHDCWKGVYPLNHTVMVCIDLVARGQGGGAYTHDKYPPASLFCTTPHPLKYMAPPPCQPVGSCRTGTVQRRPCIICAMPLVQSRIGRVFYGTASTDGAFGTKWKIHTQKDLTHRFEVFKGVLGQQYQN